MPSLALKKKKQKNSSLILWQDTVKELWLDQNSQNIVVNDVN